jgi:hypothetical protein
MADFFDDKPSQDSLWQKSDVARYCSVGTRTVENWMAIGLPHIKIRNVVRFKPRDVLDFLEARRRVARS